jgi:ribose 5-phosphate isomerase A
MTNAYAGFYWMLDAECWMLISFSSNMTDVWPAAVHAAELIERDMIVGLGTGRAAAMFVHALARRVRDGLSVRGIPTSVKTAQLAEELAIPLTSLDEVRTIDIDVDGADEVDPDLNLIKGHGGALLRERVVASISKVFVVIVGTEKLVPHLGAKMSVPVEVVPFAVPVAREALRELGADVQLRIAEHAPFVSDNGNHILDARFEDIGDGGALERRIDEIPGVVDSGLFIGMADRALVHEGDRFRTIRPASLGEPSS